MNTERASTGPWRDAMVLFDAWLDADASERAELLAQAQADTVQHQKLLALIAADVKNDPRKLDGFEEFAADLPGTSPDFRTFVERRRTYLLNYQPAVRAALQ